MADYARGDELRRLRESMRISQEAAGSRLGVTAKTVATWEKGGAIRWPNALKLGELYGRDPEDLVSRHDPQAAGMPVVVTQLDRIEDALERLETIARLLLEERDLALPRLTDDDDEGLAQPGGHLRGVPGDALAGLEGPQARRAGDTRGRSGRRPRR